MEEYIVEIVTSIPVVGFAFFIYARESKRVDTKDKTLLDLVRSVTENNVKVSENLERLSRALEKLGNSVEKAFRK